MDSHRGGDLIVDDELADITEGFQVRTVDGARGLVGGISFQSVSEVCKRASGRAWLEAFQGAEHDLRINVNGFRVDSVAGLSVAGLIGGGGRVELLAELFNMAINRSNRHGLGETSKGGAVVVSIGCHLGSFSISLTLIMGRDTRDVMGGFAEDREISRAKEAESAPHHSVSIVIAVR